MIVKNVILKHDLLRFIFVWQYEKHEIILELKYKLHIALFNCELLPKQKYCFFRTYRSTMSCVITRISGTVLCIN